VREDGVRTGRHRGIPRHSRRCPFDQTVLAGSSGLAFVSALRQAAKEHDMADPKKGKGGFKEFAQHEKVVVNTGPSGTTQPVTPTSTPGAPALKLDVSAKTAVKP
jgi:hypothetical protein